MKKSVIFFLCALLVFSLCACENEKTKESEKPFYEFCDSIGQKIVLKKKPERVAVLFSSFAEMWGLAGGETKISVFESVERGFCGENVILVDGGAGKTVNTEALVSGEPDFVICSADVPAQKEAASFLSEKNIPSAVFRVESFEDYMSVFKIFCEITENPQNYKENAEKVKENIDKMFNSLEKEPKYKKILFIRAGSSKSSTKAKRSEEHFAAAMLSSIGCQNIADSASVVLDGISDEAILRYNPDYIFISTMGKEEAARAYMDSVLKGKVFSSLDCVKKGNYCYLPKNLFQFKPNNKWDEAYSFLIDIVYGN